MAKTKTAHGMDGSLVEPDWPPLTVDEARLILGLFPGVKEPIEILSASPRPFSAASVVRAGSRRLFVKRHARAVRDRDGLREEHQFMEYLRAAGIAVPEVLQSESGETAIEVNGWTYEVHEAPDGIDLYVDAISWTPFFSPEHAFAAGQMLAKLHLAACGFDAAARKVQPLVSSFTIFAGDDTATAMEHYLADRPALASDAETQRNCAHALDLLRPFHEELLPQLPRLQPLWMHNDLHGSNLFWSDAGENATATGVIDFGLADRTNAVHDLAIAIERNMVDWLALVNRPEDPEAVPVHLDHLRALLDGYDSARKMSDAEAAALAPMTALCHAEFALTEADYFLGVLQSPEKARMASDGYLIGHARWFGSGPGRMLLNEIRTWAAARARRNEVHVR